MNSQKRDNRRKTLRHESHQDGDSERDGLFALAFVRGRDTDNEEHDGEDDGNGRHHHDETATVSSC